MSDYRMMAIARISKLLELNQYERPADIIADIMHYCDSGLDEDGSFAAELERAQMYYDDETIEDEVQNETAH